MSEQTEKTAGAADSQAGSTKGVILTGVRAGILGLKSGMTQIFNKDGDMVPVTVIDLQPTVITQVKTKAKEGYDSVQVGFLPKKPQRTTKADKGHFKKSGAPGFYHVLEFPLASVAGIQEGALVLPDFVKEGDLVDVTAVSKGKGMQGAMKRYNFSGNYKSHGCSVSHRSLGSIGNRADPGKTFKNKKMPGHMGHEQTTVQNLRVVSIDRENNLMLVRGSVPGPKNGLLTVRKAIKDNG